MRPLCDLLQNTNGLLGSTPKEKQIDTFFIADDDDNNNNHTNISDPLYSTHPNVVAVTANAIVVVAAAAVVLIM